MPYTARDKYATEDQVITLVRALVTALQPEYVIETGTYVGDTAKAIGEALLENGHGHLETLEVDPERAEVARKAVRGLPVTVHNTSSLNFTPVSTIDFAWIDSKPPHREHEILRYRPWFRRPTRTQPGATIAVHDTHPRYKVRPALDRLAETGVLRPAYLRTERGVAIAEML